MFLIHTGILYGLMTGQTTLNVSLRLTFASTSMLKFILENCKHVVDDRRVHKKSNVIT